jgi:general stress protein 26
LSSPAARVVPAASSLLRHYVPARLEPTAARGVPIFPLQENMMTTPHDIEAKFWKALKSDRTVMLGLNGVEDGHARPMTAQFEDDRAPLWFFCSADNGLIPLLGGDDRAIATFVDKGNDLFATINGRISLDMDPATIDRLWNSYIAAWFEGGRSDPKLRLLRLDAEHAEIWLNENSLLAGVKMLFGVDPKEDYKDKVATVGLG